MRDSKKYLGLEEETARRLAETAGHRFRVARREGKALILTRDFKPDRINVCVEEGKVVEVHFG
jgi:hypothetical protein